MRTRAALPSILLLMLPWLPDHAHAQPGEPGNWYQYFGINPVSARWLVHNEVQYRSFNLAGDLEQLLLRAGAGYNLTESNHNVLLGYAYLYNETYRSLEKVASDENRFFAQYIVKHPAGRISVGHRCRLEYRLREETEAWRARYMVWIQLPLNKPVLEKGCIFFMASNELFVNTTGTGFDRNRLYGALGYALNHRLTVEIGMMRQSLASSARDQFQVAVFNRLPWHAERKP